VQSGRERLQFLIRSAQGAKAMRKGARALRFCGEENSYLVKPQNRGRDYLNQNGPGSIPGGIQSDRKMIGRSDLMVE